MLVYFPVICAVHCLGVRITEVSEWLVFQQRLLWLLTLWSWTRSVQYSKLSTFEDEFTLSRFTHVIAPSIYQSFVMRRTMSRESNGKVDDVM